MSDASIPAGTSTARTSIHGPRHGARNLTATRFFIDRVLGLSRAGNRRINWKPCAA
jgi:hypothetical protein